MAEAGRAPLANLLAADVRTVPQEEENGSNMDMAGAF